MSIALPIVRGTSTALYPFVQTYVAHTAISDAQNGSTARVVQSPPTVKFDFPYVPIKKSEKDTLKTFLAARLGQFATAITATTDKTYTALSFDDDQFSAVEQSTTQYGTRWSLSQTIAQNLSPGSSGGAYPTLANGCISQLAYSQQKRFQTITAKLPGGTKSVSAEFGGGLTNYPTDGLMGWILDERTLSDADVNTKIQHWIDNWGNALPFTFTDEDAVPYSKVYYGSPELVITRHQPNLASIKTILVATF